MWSATELVCCRYVCTYVCSLVATQIKGTNMGVYRVTTVYLPPGSKNTAIEHADHSN